MEQLGQLRTIERFSEYELKTFEHLNVLSYTDFSHIYNGAPCKRFNGATNHNGYGSIDIYGITYRVHRVSAYLFFGFPLDNSLLVCHGCDTRDCWEPLHLFAGTNQDNNQDSANKGRHRNTKVTHCPKGHEYTLENTIVVDNPSTSRSRRCRICTQVRKEVWRNQRRSQGLSVS